MKEVTLENFSVLYPEIEKSLKSAKFIAIDTEFSALNPTPSSYNSLFDSPSERYRKLRKTVELINPVQIGITAFSFDGNENSYAGDSFTFYVFPRSFSIVNRSFVCQASCLQFLNVHGFDFNKETDVRSKVFGGFFTRDSEVDGVIAAINEEIANWLVSAKFGDALKLKNHYQCYPEILYFLHKSLRARKLWSYCTPEGVFVKKAPEDEFKKLIKDENLEEELLDSLLGFTKVFRLLTALKKPIIGHNVLTDLALLANTFESPLPASYTKFKRFLHNLFPTVYDTKTISYELRNTLPENRRWKQNLLDALYVFFKDGDGRHLALNSPFIGAKGDVICDQFHNAGFDSYCTGYIFVRMAHVFVSKGSTNPKQAFMCGQLLNAVSAHKNCLNVIRGAVAYVQLDGDDPASTRPPWLVVESVQNKPVDLSQVSSILSNYGFVEIRPLKRGRQAIVAVDNFSSARRILSQFKARNDFRIKQYNVLQHSFAAKTAVWSSLLASSLLVIWLAHNAFRK